LLAGVAGPEAVLARFERELPALVRGDGLENFVCLRGERETAVWTWVRDLTPAFLRAHPNGCVVKASLPLTAMGSYLSQSRQPTEEAGLTVVIHTRAGSGIAYLYLYAASGRASDADGERIGKVIEHLIRDAEHHGGRAIVEWCPAEWKSKMNLWGTLGDDWVWMRKLKTALDPQGLLNPGRFYGGI
jgi:glycolate oxidase FAD binding subunit